MGLKGVPVGVPNDLVHEFLVKSLAESLFHDVGWDLSLPEARKFQFSTQLLDNLGSLGLNRACWDRYREAAAPGFLLLHFDLEVGVVSGHALLD
jgi:hypothetical protein